MKAQEAGWMIYDNTLEAILANVGLYAPSLPRPTVRIAPGREWPDGMWEREIERANNEIARAKANRPIR